MKRLTITTSDAEGRALLRAGEAEAKRRGLASVEELVTHYLANFTPESIRASLARIDHAQSPTGDDTPALEPDTAEALRAFIKLTHREPGLTPTRIFSELVLQAVHDAAANVRAIRARRLAERGDYETVALPAATVREAQIYAERRGYSVEGVISRATIDYLDRRGDNPGTFAVEMNDESGRMRRRYNKGLQLSGLHEGIFCYKILELGITEATKRRKATPRGNTAPVK